LQASNDDCSFVIVLETRSWLELLIQLGSLGYMERSLQGSRNSCWCHFQSIFFSRGSDVLILFQIYTYKALKNNYGFHDKTIEKTIGTTMME